jgi:hypothetical protein
MKELSPRARELLAAYRVEHRPSQAALERAARGLGRRLAHGETASVDVDATPPKLAVKAAARGARVGMKVAAALAGAALVVMVAAGMRGTEAAGEEPRRKPSAEAKASLGVSARPSPNPGPSLIPSLIPSPNPSPSPSQLPDSVRSANRIPTPRRKPNAATPPEPPPSTPPPSPVNPVEPSQPAIAAAPAIVAAPQSAAVSAPQPIDEEVALLRAAYTALHAGDAQRALVHLAEHRWRFPKGQLAEAREVARMLALCANGDRAGARAEAKRFLAARPRSPFAQRVSSICEAGETAVTGSQRGGHP